MTEQHSENFALICEAFIEAILNRADPDDPQQCIDEANDAALDLMVSEIDFWADRLRDSEYEACYNPDGAFSRFCFVPVED